jgi:glyoxylase-like metal-dependent hydrolase (beta-lactamase superfamily II)
VEKHIIYPVRLATFRGIDYSHQVLNQRFGEKIDTAVLSFLIAGKNSLMVVDTGFRTAKGDFHMEGSCEESYREKFEALGRTYDQVTHVLLTHLHWDHMELNGLFPMAKIYVQRREVEVAAAPVYPLYYERADIARLIGEEGDRLVFLDGDAEVVPGVKAVFAGGHTLGSQMIFVSTSAGNAVITGDIMNLYANLEERSVKEVDVIAWVRAIDRIKREADVILPSHDLAVLERYPVVGG